MPAKIYVEAPHRQSPARRERLWRLYAAALRRRIDDRYDRRALRVIERAEKRLGIDHASYAA